MWGKSTEVKEKNMDEGWGEWGKRSGEIYWKGVERDAKGTEVSIKCGAMEGRKGKRSEQIEDE